MKTAVFGDLHSNFTAWKKAFQIMEKKGVERFLCTGDLVGYGPQPNKIVSDIKDKIKQGLNIQLVMGNHDKGVVDDSSLRRFNSHAREALLWTRKQLSAENKEFLAELPLTIEKENLILAHGSPNNPIWEYLRPWTAKNILNQYDFEICFVGHTHLVQLFTNSSQQERENPIANPAVINLNSDSKTIVNVGSIGQPRDYNPQSSFVIWDEEISELEIIRCKYDIKHVQNLIYKTDLPALEGDRLAKGK